MIPAREVLFTARSLAGFSHVTEDALAAFRDARVRRLIRHAYDRVPWYHSLFEAHGIRPADIRGVRDLPRVPATGRAELQACAAEAVVARGIDLGRLVVNRT
ncbi:MAG: hypothetical protein H0V09_10225, partial [Gemmatimonadetes bacterium]|nr:hypothetical protein [Gemmatimonadota bacterium]